MNDIDAILNVIDQKAHHYHACAYPDYGTSADDWAQERALCVARYEALKEIEGEIRASFKPYQLGDELSATDEPNMRWIFLTEMGGALHATMFAVYADAEKAKQRFCRDYRLECEHEAHAACEIEPVWLPPRLEERSSGVDARFASIVQTGGRIEASIHETFEEAEAANEAAWEWYGDDDTFGLQTILVPRFPD